MKAIVIKMQYDHNLIASFPTFFKFWNFKSRQQMTVYHKITHVFNWLEEKKWKNTRLEKKDAFIKFEMIGCRILQWQLGVCVTKEITNRLF